MNRARLATMAASFAASFFLAACSGGKADPKAEAPPTPTVEHEQDLNVVQVDHPEQFPLATAIEHIPTSQLTATGTVSPDISRSVPVISIATGRVVEIKARLGDTVKKGQLLLRVQSADMSAAFSDYRKAVADEKLARIQADRAKLLYHKGAISLNDFQTAGDLEKEAHVDVQNASRRRTKGRIDQASQGTSRMGCLVPATFHGQKKETRAAVPATAILHLHDRDWVYVPLGGNKFRRTEVTAGNSLPDKIQEIISGIRPGQQVVSNALVLQNTVEQ